MRLIAHLGATCLVLAGAGLILLYGLIALGVVDTEAELREAGVIAGFGMAALIAAGLLEAALHRPRRSPVTAVRLPPLWLSFAAFVAVLALGTVLVVSDAAAAADPLLAVAAIAALFAFIGRLALVWTPGKRAPGYTVFATTVWGMIVATSAAVLLQLMIAAALFAAVLLGLVAADVDLSGGLAETLASETVLEDSGSRLMGTATVAIAAFSLYAIVAPLTEELMKLLGVVAVMRRRAPSGYTTFLAGVFVGLGFALVETLAFSLAAGKAWPLLLALRAPVALLHVAGATITARGWYLQRTRGGYPLVGYFAAAVLVHGAWNGSLVALTLMSATIADPDQPEPAVVLGVLGVLGLLALLLVACAAWVVLNARRWGREHVAEEPAAPATAPELVAAAAPAAGIPGVSHSISGEV